MRWIKWVLAFVFDCVHRRTTWPHRDRRGFNYVCCLECGRELPYSTRRMSIVTREVLLADRNFEEDFQRTRRETFVRLTREGASQLDWV
jgi:hypothetical protein